MIDFELADGFFGNADGASKELIRTYVQQGNFKPHEMSAIKAACKNQAPSDALSSRYYFLLALQHYSSNPYIANLYFSKSYVLSNEQHAILCEVLKTATDKHNIQVAKNYTEMEIEILIQNVKDKTKLKAKIRALIDKNNALLPSPHEGPLGQTNPEDKEISLIKLKEMLGELVSDFNSEIEEITKLNFCTQILSIIRDMINFNSALFKPYFQGMLNQCQTYLEKKYLKDDSDFLILPYIFKAYYVLFQIDSTRQGNLLQNFNCLFISMFPNIALPTILNDSNLSFKEQIELAKKFNMEKLNVGNQLKLKAFFAETAPELGYKFKHVVLDDDEEELRIFYDPEFETDSIPSPATVDGSLSVSVSPAPSTTPPPTAEVTSPTHTDLFKPDPETASPKKQSTPSGPPRETQLLAPSPNR